MQVTTLLAPDLVGIAMEGTQQGASNAAQDLAEEAAAHAARFIEAGVDIFLCGLGNGYEGLLFAGINLTRCLLLGLSEIQLETFLPLNAMSLCNVV